MIYPNLAIFGFFPSKKHDSVGIRIFLLETLREREREKKNNDGKYLLLDNPGKTNLTGFQTRLPLHPETTASYAQGPRGEKGPAPRIKKMRPLYLILLIQVLIGCRTLAEISAKEKSPLGQAASQNSPLCNPPKGRRGLRSRRKGKSPLRDANWPHRMSHPGANQINYAAAPRPPTLPSRPATRTPPWNLDTPCWPYKRARRSRVKQFNKRPRRDHFSEIPLQPEARRSPVSELPLQLEACRAPVPKLLLQPRAHRDPISEPLCQSGLQGGAISLPPDDCHSVSHHQQSLPSSARPDLIVEVGLEPPAVNPASRIPSEDQQVPVETTSRIPREDLPPVVC